jgi:hypothetical protein
MANIMAKIMASTLFAKRFGDLYVARALLIQTVVLHTMLATKKMSVKRVNALAKSLDAMRCRSLDTNVRMDVYAMVLLLLVIISF